MSYKSIKRAVGKVWRGDHFSARKGNSNDSWLQGVAHNYAHTLTSPQGWAKLYAGGAYGNFAGSSSGAATGATTTGGAVGAAPATGGNTQSTGAPAAATGYPENVSNGLSQQQKIYDANEKRMEDGWAGQDAGGGGGLSQEQALAVMDGDPEFRDAVMAEYQRREQAGLPQLSLEEVNAMHGQLTQQRWQAGASHRINTFFDDPARAASEDAAAKASRENQLGELATEFNGAATDNAQQVGRQGLQGGSVDISNRGKLDRANQAAASGIESDVQGQLRATRQRDQDQREQLLSLIYSGNADQQRSATAQLQALTSGANGQDALASEDNQRADIQHFGNVMQSQAIGSIGNNLARSVDQYNNSGGGGW